MPDTRLRYTVLMEQNEDGGYTVTVPSLPGCISEGSTREEALAEIEEAISGYIEVGQEARQAYSGRGLRPPEYEQRKDLKLPRTTGEKVVKALRAAGFEGGWHPGQPPLPQLQSMVHLKIDPWKPER